MIPMATYYKNRLNYTDTVLLDSPVAFWPMNETTGTTIHDISGNNYNGTLSGVYQINQPSLLPSDEGRSIYLSGNTSRIVLPNVAALNNQAYPVSLEAWIYLTNAANKAVIMAMGSSNSPAMAISSMTANRISYGNTGAGNGVASTNVIASAQAYHIVITVDNQGNVIFYVNGQSAGTGQLTATYTGSGAGMLGTYPQAPTTYVLQGNIQFFAFYNTLLSPTRVIAHYNAA